MVVSALRLRGGLGLTCEAVLRLGLQGLAEGLDYLCGLEIA